MTDSPNTAHQQGQTPEEVRQQLLVHLDASKEAVSELSENELEAVAGGGFTTSLVGGLMSGLLGGSGGGGGVLGSTAANTHSNSIATSVHSAADSALGEVNIGNKFLK